jgi:toxin ParE1/3/4
MHEYRLTKKAEEDLLAIALYGIERFGAEQSLIYRDRMRVKLEELARFPDRYPRVDYVREGVRRSICGVHSIYYRHESYGVLILRILGRQDLNRAFDE